MDNFGHCVLKLMNGSVGSSSYHSEISSNTKPTWFNRINIKIFDALLFENVVINEELSREAGGFVEDGVGSVSHDLHFSALFTHF